MTEHQERGNRPLADALISVVLPIYNEAAGLTQLLEAVGEELIRCGCHYEVICVNDGSDDDSGALLDACADADRHVRVLHLSRNFGHQAAVQAGLVHAAGDAVIVMDADMQDDPASIARFLDKWREGFDVVYAIRVGRKEHLIKRALFFLFYRLFRMISRTPIPADAGIFGLVDRRVVQEITRLSDRDRYYPGLRHWVGFRQMGIPVERGARYDARPRQSSQGLWQLAKTAVFSFSSFPLTIFYGIAGVAVVILIGLVSFTLYHRLVTGLAIPGWTSIIMTACIFGALNALGIAILGEYVLRIYDQVRARPLFLIERTTNVPEDEEQRADENAARPVPPRE